MKLHLSPEAAEGTATNPQQAFGNWMTNLPSLADPDAAPPAAPAPPEPTAKPAAPAAAPAAAPEPPKDGGKTPPPPEEDDNKWPRSAADWKKAKQARREAEEALKKERDAIKAERDAVKAELEAAKKQGPSPELESLKKQVTELDEALKRSSVENHPKFKAYYDGKINGKIMVAKNIVGPDKAAEVEKYLRMADSEWRTAKLEEIVADLPAIRQSQFGSILTGLDEIMAERQSEIDKGRDNAAVYAAQQEAQAKQHQEAMAKLIEDTLGAVKTGELQGVLTDEDAALARTVCLQGTKDPAEFVKLAARGIAYPNMLKGWLADKAKITELEGQLKALQAAQPGGGDGGGAPVEDRGIAVGSSPQEASKTFIERVQKAMRG